MEIVPERRTDSQAENFPAVELQAEPLPQRQHVTSDKSYDYFPSNITPRPSIPFSPISVSPDRPTPNSPSQFFKIKQIKVGNKTEVRDRQPKFLK
jgi:hypothetical protein